MYSRQLNKQYDQIMNLIKNTSASCGENIELQGHWAKYVCVLAAGFLENALSEVYIPMVGNSASPAVSNFTQKVLNKIQNPKANKFYETANSFKKDWGDEVEKLFQTDPAVKEAIDSIMRIRHLIAHGKNTSVSIVKVKEYLESAVRVIDLIEKQCGYHAQN